MHPLARMILHRLALGLLTLFAISLFIFMAIELLPGDLAEEVLGQSATPETVAAFRRDLGLDQPAYVRYLDWLGGIVRGDFGQSLANNRPISDLLAARLGNTLFMRRSSQCRWPWGWDCWPRCIAAAGLTGG